MGSLTRPVGPLPASVYWVRRGVLLLVLLALVLLVWALWPHGGGGGGTTTAAVPPTTGQATSPATSPSPPTAGSPSPTLTTPTPTPIVLPCRDPDVGVRLTADATRYAPGAQPRFTLTVTNVSKRACTRAVGPAALSISIASGGAHVWSSDDCSPGGDQGVVQLGPGASRTVSVTWGRMLSAPGCPRGRPPAGMGQYVATGRAGTARSNIVIFDLA